MPPFAAAWPYVMPIVLLVCSNVFMTLAWYGHLNFKAQPLILVVLASWGIAFFEYCLAVPANRYGNAVYSAAQLKTMQEVITLVVFCGFSVVYLKEPLGWNHAVGFALIAVGAAVFRGHAVQPRADRSTARLEGQLIRGVRGRAPGCPPSAPCRPPSPASIPGAAGSAAH